MFERFTVPFTYFSYSSVMSDEEQGRPSSGLFSFLSFLIYRRIGRRFRSLLLSTVNLCEGSREVCSLVLACSLDGWILILMWGQKCVVFTYITAVLLHLLELEFI